MDKILLINACVRQNSRTYDLAQHVLRYFKGDLTELVLKNENIVPLNEKELENRTEYIKGNEFTHKIFNYAKQFSNSDIIVIAAPYWDLSFPALLKTYIEAICIAGITFKYRDGIPQGLCKAKRLIYVTTSGGQIGNLNLGFDYIKALSQNLFGISDIQFFSAQNLDIIGNCPDELIGLAKKEIDKTLKSS